MADTYGVTAADVAGELPTLFAGGFSESTIPTAQSVADWITAADVTVTLAVRSAAGADPQASDTAAPLAKRYIFAAVKAEVMRAVYAGRDPQQVKAAADQFQSVADDMLAAIKQLGAQATAAGAPRSRVLGAEACAGRDLLVSDADLDGRAGSRARRF